MDEKILQRRLKKLTIYVIIIGIATIIAGGLMAESSQRMIRENIDIRLENVTEQYRINLNRRLYADIQTLNTLAAFFSFSDMDTYSFAQGLLESNSHNNYIRMAYYGRSGVGIRVMLDSRIEMDVEVDSLNEDVAKTIRGAWEGQAGISRIYNDRNLDEEVFAYAVPVYAGDEVIGALAASLSTDVFEAMLEDKTPLNDQGYVHMVSDSGKILIRSKDQLIDAEVSSIYDGDYISDSEKERVRAALAAGQVCFTNLTYEGQEYPVYLEPMGINGWYLFCVQTAHVEGNVIYRLIMVNRTVVSVILILLMLFIIFGYRMLRKSNKRLIRLAYYDPLTGAYNLDRFTQEVSGKVEDSREYSLIALNVRQFKFINEIFGNRQADRLLRHIKSVIASHVQEGEYFCRGSADMFYIFLWETDRERIKIRMESIFSSIDSYAISNNRDYHVQMYCGVVVGTDVDEDAPSLEKSMVHVMFALDTARTSAKDRVWFYDTRLHEDEKLENYVGTHMRQALEDKEFKLYLQPKMDLRAGKIGGAEALVRWITGSGRTIYPGQFIPLFEKNGFCVDLDMYMVDQVCRQIREWIDAGVPPIPLSVNQSKLLFYEADYIDNMKRIIQKYDIPARLVTLEILEGLAMENVDVLNEKIARLKEIGFRISMDDFGSGYSSLNTLASLKIDELKLDRVFLMRIGSSRAEDMRQKVIMSEIVDLTKKLDMTTVVEGVETQENEDLIRKLDCDYGQGYYYSRPIRAEAFTEKYILDGEES